MANIKLSDEVQALLTQLKAASKNEISLDIGEEKAGFVRYDQSYQTRDQKRLVIHVKDVTALDYTLSHELLHALMDTQGFPTIQFNLTSGHKDFDEQLMLMTTALYDTATHLYIYDWQRQHGLLTADVEAAYLKGVIKTITPEANSQPDTMMHLRLMTVLDALVFFGARFTEVEAQFKRDYPLTLAGAKQIYAQLTEKKTNSPFTLRRTVVKLFAAFDRQLKDWGLATVGGNEFVTLSSVFSQRQLRLEIRQLFQITHSDVQDLKTHQRAYVGLGITDHQNAFVLPSPPKAEQDTYFKELYSLSVADFYHQFGLAYTIR
ncbi:IpaB/EvcA family protein [Pediococcus siamensis]|uniref:IpaB/EvcA family protein n=1 Tax=Pediococcus siamensis TaxID=381829 RepID=UPI0039A0A1BC